MNRRFTERYQRAAAIMLLIAAATLVAALLVWPVAQLYRERAAEIDDLHGRVLAFRASALHQGAFTQQLEQLRSDPQIASYHLKNAAPALAAAELQQHIKKTLETHGGQLVSMQVIESTAVPGLSMVTVRIRLRAGIGALQQVLHELESGRPLLVLDNVFLRAVGPGHSAGTGSLDAGFDASGYLPGWAS